MATSRSWRREAACLLLGLVVGAGAAAIYRRVPVESGRISSLPVSSSAFAAVPAEPVAASSEPGLLPRHRRRASSDWKQVAAGFRAPGGDLGPARSLLYQLDARALRKLAASVSAWPRDASFHRAMREVFHRWGGVDPVAALAQAQAFPDRDSSSTAIQEAMRGFAEMRPAQAAAYFAAPPASGDRNELRSLGERRSALNVALASWAEQDGPAATGFLDQLPANTLYIGFAYRVATEFARQDPAAAMRWAARVGEPEARSSAVGGVIATWTETNPAAAASYVLGVSADAQLGNLVDPLVRAWASQDLPGAARWVAAQNGAVQAKAATALAWRWASDDPAGAAAWADQLSGDARSDAYSTIARQWTGADPAAARNWLDSLPADDARDAAVDGYVTDYRNPDPPAEKLARSAQIGDAGKRETVQVHLLNNWLEVAPQAARQWVSQANLPAAVTAKLNKG